MPDNIKQHEIVNHSAKEYVRGQVHTGTIDGYWGLLKRGLIGSYHRVSISICVATPRSSECGPSLGGCGAVSQPNTLDAKATGSIVE
jgi:hypothetical protein